MTAVLAAVIVGPIRDLSHGLCLHVLIDDGGWVGFFRSYIRLKWHDIAACHWLPRFIQEYQGIIGVLFRAISLSFDDEIFRHDQADIPVVFCLECNIDDDPDPILLL